MSDAPVLVIEGDTERARTWQELLEFADSVSLTDSFPDATLLQVPHAVNILRLVNGSHGMRRRRSVQRGSS